MKPEGFEPTKSADERPQNHALDRMATGTGIKLPEMGYNHFNDYVNNLRY
jgi:hypothetical protein